VLNIILEIANIDRKTFLEKSTSFSAKTQSIKHFSTAKRI